MSRLQIYKKALLEISGGADDPTAIARAALISTPREKRSQMIGNRFGRLVVVARDDSHASGHGLHSFWICKCDCGTEKSISGNHLKRGAAQSCGCLRNEKAKYRMKKRHHHRGKLFQDEVEQNT
jgi:hypothetical protein